MIGYSASWVVPISDRPVPHGWITVDAGRVTGRGVHGSEPSGIPIHDLGDFVVMPGLVNAHTHLELSYLRHAIQPAESFVAWVGQLIALRAKMPDPRDPTILQAAGAAIDEARRSGTTLVGDISNTLVTFDLLAASPLGAVVFHELLGFRVEDAQAFVASAVARVAALGSSPRVRATLAAHAPYSVAPALYGAIRQAVERDAAKPYSVHLSESPEEVQFVRSADGPWRELLERIGTWNPAWTAPGRSPVEYLDREGFLGPKALAAHGVQMSDADLQLLRQRGVTLVTCPRSNVYVGVGSPPVERFYASGVNVAVGTDSLASTTDLNLFTELAAMRRLAPSVPASCLLDSATRQGARALGFDADYGTIEAGKYADLLAVEAPGALGDDDVEEYLVSGIEPARLRWLSGV